MPAAKTQKDKPVSSKKVSMSGSKKASPAKSKKAMSSKSKLVTPSAPADTVAKIIAKKKAVFSKEDSIQIYIFRILKKVHPELGISKAAMLTLNSLILDIYRKVANAAAHLSKSSKQQTLTGNDIQSATKLCIPGEVGRLAVSEGCKAVTFYQQN